LVVASKPAAASLPSDEALLASDAAASFLASTSMAGRLTTLTAVEVPLVFHFHRLEFVDAQGKGRPGRERDPAWKPHRDCCFCWSLETAAVKFFPATRLAFALERFFPLAAVKAASASAQATALRSHGETEPYPAAHEHPAPGAAAEATSLLPPGSRHCGTTQIAPDDAASAWALGAMVVRAPQNFWATEEFFDDDDEDFPTERSADAYADATSSRRPSGLSEDDTLKAAKSSSSSTSAASAAASSSVSAESRASGSSTASASGSSAASASGSSAARATASLATT
jgi:hypothetical protein